MEEKKRKSMGGRRKRCLLFDLASQGLLAAMARGEEED